MTVDDIGGGFFCIFSKPILTSFVSNPLLYKIYSSGVLSRIQGLDV